MGRPSKGGFNKVTKTLADGTVKTYWYHRASGTRLLVDPSTLPKDDPRPVAERALQAGSVAALCVAYLKSPEYLQTAQRTRSEYRRYIEYLRDAWGLRPVRSLTRSDVFELRDRFAATPRTANFYVQVLRLLMTFAVDRGWRKDNPALRPKFLKTGEGYRPWEEHEVAAFRQHWPAESRERVAFELMINTGQRTADIVAMTRDHLRRGVVAVKQLKTGARVWVPLAMDLAIVLGPWLSQHDEDFLLPSEKGGPITTSGLRQIMRPAYKAAGLPVDAVNHGLRYTAAVRLAELGCDWETIASITGHETVQMVRKYLSKRRLAEQAIRRLNQRG